MSGHEGNERESNEREASEREASGREASGREASVVVGFFLLAIFLPLGLTLEALHAMKTQVYLGSDLRRQLWTLAHAHGNLLGILCLVYGGLSPRWISDRARRRSIGRWLILGSVCMPAGFFAGGVLNTEGDPSIGILLVPAGGLCLLVALLRAGIASCKVSAE